MNNSMMRKNSMCLERVGRGFVLLVLCFVVFASNVSAQTDPGFKDLVGSKKGSKEPVFVKSDSLELDAKNRIFTYKGNVEVIQGEMTMTCDLMLGEYDASNELKKITCNDNVVITNGETTRATSNRATFFVPQSRVELTEAPELVKDSNLLAADKITIFVKEDRSEAEGNVRVKVLKPEGAS